MRRMSIIRLSAAAVLLAACLLVCACACALESGECGEHLTWTLADNGTLTITGYGEMTDYAEAPWGSPEAVTRVSFIAESSEPASPSDLGSGTVPVVGITAIGSHAFDGCTALTSITVPDTVALIGTAAFSGCTALEEVTLPAGISGLLDSTFQGCTSLTSIALPDLTVLGASCFEGCTSLAEIALPANIGNIGRNAFAGCTGLAGLTLPAGLRDIDSSAFAGCTGLTGLTLPAGTRTIGPSAFEGCTGLAALHLNEGLTTLDMKAFAGCTCLRSVTLPASLGDIGYRAFYGCDALSRVAVKGMTTKTPAYAFSAARPLLYCYTGSTADQTAGYTRRHLDGAALILPAGLERIDSEALSGLESAEVIRIPGSVTVIAADALADTEAAVFAPAGSYAARWAAQHGLALIEE